MPGEQRAGCQLNTGDHFPFILRPHCGDHNGLAQPGAGRWCHTLEGDKQGTHCGPSWAREEGDACLDSDIHRGVVGVGCLLLLFVLVLSSRLNSHFSASLQNMDTLV